MQDLLSVTIKSCTGVTWTQLPVQVPGDPEDEPVYYESQANTGGECPSGDHLATQSLSLTYRDEPGGKAEQIKLKASLSPQPT